MNLLSILLIVASLLFVAMGCLHVYSIIQYNDRLRKQRSRTKSRLGRRKQPKRLDLMTVFLFLTALLLLLVALLIHKYNPPAPPSPTEPQPDSTQTAATNPPKEDRWQEESGTYYYELDDGTKATGWQDIGGYRYYFQDNGAMVVGWQEVDGATYYFRADGKMAVGTVTVDGINYHFTASGQQVLLVNPQNPAPENLEPKLIALSSDYGAEGCQVDQSCLNDLISMLEACNAATSKVVVTSGYRSYGDQQRAYQRVVNNYLSAGETQEAAEEKAAAEVPVPGTSEHQLGLAVDIMASGEAETMEAQASSDAQKWLWDHAWEYGFILRYPEDQTEVTGVAYEPWHYRYVGKVLAEELHNANLTLEAYLVGLN